MSARDPLVSVIIPVYNAEAYLKACVDSVLVQSWPSLEIILVNDGSKDRSLALAHGFQDSRIRVLDQSNKGASAARNHGLAQAQGDYIQFLDADDLLSPEKIKLQVELLQRNPDACIASCPWGRFVHDPQQANFESDGLWQDLAPIDFLAYKYNQHSMMQPGVWLLPRAVVERAGTWDESLSLNDDGEYFSRVVLQAHNILFCPEAKVYYRSANQHSLAAQKSMAHLHSLCRSVELCAEQLLAREQSPSTQQAVVNLYQELIYTLYPFLSEQIKELEAKIKSIGLKATRPLPGGPARQSLARWIGWKSSSWLYQYYQLINQQVLHAHRHHG